MALTQRFALQEYGLVPSRCGVTATIIKNAFLVQDTNTDGLTDAAEDGNPVGISDRACTVNDAYVGQYTSGVWKVLGTAGDTYEPGNFVYCKTNITVALDAVGDDTTYPCGLVVGKAAVAGALYLYIIFIPHGIMSPAKYQTS